MDLRKENPLPQFNVASYERPGLKLAFEDTKIQCDTTSRIFFFGGGGGGGRIATATISWKMLSKHAI